MHSLKNWYRAANLVMALSVMGCSWVDVPEAKSTTGRSPTVAEVPSPDETVRGENDPPVTTLELGATLHERRLSRSEELPGGIMIPTTNLNATPVTAALQAVLAGTDVSLSWEASSFGDRLVSVSNLSGPLPRVVAKICSAAKLFCNYRHGLLELKEKETFVVDLPAVPNSKSGAVANTMSDAISDLAGDKVKVDTQAGNLIYTTDVEGQEQVGEYISQLRNGRPLVVLQLYIWEVTLNRENATGINWTKFGLGKIGGLAQSVTTGGSTAFTSLASAGLTLNSTFKGKVDAQQVIQFLQTQGSVQTISSPQMTFVSGANAEFRVGGKQRYVSQVGTSSSNNVNGTTTNNSNNTIQTDSIDTGLTVDVGGSFENGIISAALELSTQDLISLNPITNDGVTIDLPETSERKVQTSIRVRPGDNLVMAGLVTSRDENTRQGIPLPFDKSLPTFKDDNLKNTELVLLVKPSVVLFSDAKARADEKKRENDTQTSRLPDAVMIDKDGAKTINMPNSDKTSAADKPVIKPAPQTPPSQAIVAQPAANGDTPVDRLMLQRGFSHAYDQLLEPVAAAKPAGGHTN